MAKHYDKQFKIDAVRYYHDHKDLGLIDCASNPWHQPPISITLAERAS